MIQPLLQTALQPVVERRRHFALLRDLNWGWAGLALAAGVVLLAVPHSTGWATLLIFLGAALLVGLTVWWRQGRWEPDYREIARNIERQHPELHALLLTAVEQRPPQGAAELTFLQQRVVAQAIAESRRQPWLGELPWYRWVLAGALQLALALVLIFLLLQLAGLSTPLATHVPALARATEQKPALVVPPIEVTPGHAEVERGTGLLITALFPQDVPTAATLLVERAGGATERIALSKNLNDPVFAGGLAEVSAPLTYRVEFDGHTSEPYQVKVYDFPKLEQADARLEFPAYTKLAPRDWPDFKRLTAVEGTTLTATLKLNKPVRKAWLQTKLGEVIPLVSEPGQPLLKWPAMLLMQSQTFTLHLEDEDGRANKSPDQFVIEVKANKAPELKFITPRGDIRLSPLQEVLFQAEAWDDFGLQRWGLSFTTPKGETKEIVLGEAAAADARVRGQHLLALETLGAQPDELFSWHLWADDTGADGQTRRTRSDIYFGEVRPFEEIFRMSQGGEGKPQQQGTAAELAKLQKQIITATWNLERSESARTAATEPSERYGKEQPVLAQSQAAVQAQGQEAKAKMEDPKSIGLMEEALAHMKQAEEKFRAAEGKPKLLKDAQPPAQAAYAALLRLAAHEYEVSRSQSQSASESPVSQQLQNLELKPEDQRYEQKSEAGTPEAEAQREQLAVLNQLREMSQRQQDLNERMREAQNALQESKTEQEKEEARRQLKRLQEEQQQMLTDLDELRQKMETSQNASQMAEERKRLEETRQRAQQANEKLREEKPGEALAAASRVQQDLQQLREDFRKKSSARFQEQMRDLRHEARSLAQRQEELGQQLENEANPTGQELRSLENASPREQLGKAFEQQEDKLKQMRESMQRISEEAEGAEPGLARELYDALRKNAQAGTEETLDKAGQLAGRGLASQARPFEQKARGELQQFSEQVSRAAESVLGDEAEALRKAGQELDQLANAVERELARARPDLAAANKRPGQGEQGDQPAPGEQPGEQKAARQTPGGEKPGQEGESQTPAGGTKPGQKPGEGQEGKEGQPGSQEGEGQTAGTKPGEKPGPGQQAGKDGQQPGQQAGQDGQQPGQQPGQKPGEQPGGQMAGQQPGGQQPGQQPGGQQPGQQPGGQMAGQQPGGQQPGQSSQQPGQSPGGQQAGNDRDPNGQPREPKSLRELASSDQRGGAGGGMNDRGGALTQEEGPLTGQDYARWADRLRGVEEQLADPKLRAEVANVREVVRGMRAEFKRHSKEPTWEAVRSQVTAPLAELRQRVSNELLKRESKEALVPIDRDPVPPQYAERVQRYYEELGRGQSPTPAK